MKIKIISALVSSLIYLNVANADVKGEQLPKTWDSSSKAIHDLMVAQIKHSSADYTGSVETLVKYAKSQKSDKLYAKAYKALLQTGRYKENAELIKHWQENSSIDLNRYHVFSLALSGEIDLAIEKLEATKKQDSEIDDKFILPYIELFLTHWYKKEITDTIAKLHDKYPDVDIISSAYSQQLSLNSKADESVEIIDKLLFKDPKNIKLLYLKSDIYRYALDLERAQEVWEKLLKDFPNDSEYRSAYADYLYKVYEYPKVLEEISKISENKLTKGAKTLYIQSLAFNEQYKEAIDKLKHYFADSKELPHKSYFLAEILIQKKQFTEAEKLLLPLIDFSTAYKATSLDSAIVSLIGQIYYSNDDKESTEKGDAWFDKAGPYLKLTKLEILGLQTNSMNKAGKSKRALEKLNSFLDANPNNKEARYQRSLIATEMDMLSLAISDLEFISANTPDDVSIQNALGYTLLDDPQRLEEGAKLIHKAIIDKPSDPATVDSMGWAEYKKGNYKEALPFLRYAYQNFLDGEIIGHYIAALYNSGNTELAKKIYQLEMKNHANVEKIKLHIDDVESKLIN